MRSSPGTARPSSEVGCGDPFAVQGGQEEVAEETTTLDFAFCMGDCFCRFFFFNGITTVQ